MSSFLDGLKGVYQGGLQGSTYGWGDEIQGAVGSALARALRPDLFGGEGFSDTYKKGRDLARAMAEQAKAQSPMAYNATEFLTGIAAPTKMLGAAGSLSGAAKTGALFGGISGAGYSEKDTASGVGFDAGISALASALAAPIIQKTAQKVAGSGIIQDEFGGVGKLKGYYSPEHINEIRERLSKNLKRMGFEINQDGSNISNSQYLSVFKDNDGYIDDIAKIRISDHELPVGYFSRNGAGRSFDYEIAKDSPYSSGDYLDVLNSISHQTGAPMPVGYQKLLQAREAKKQAGKAAEAAYYEARRPIEQKRNKIIKYIDDIAGIKMEHGAGKLRKAAVRELSIPSPWSASDVEIEAIYAKLFD